MAIPPDSEAVVIMEGVWNFTGHFINDPVISYFHTHVPKFRSAFLIAASARELGIDEYALGSDSGCSPVAPARGGFASNAALLHNVRGRRSSGGRVSGDDRHGGGTSYARVRVSWCHKKSCEQAPTLARGLCGWSCAKHIDH